MDKKTRQERVKDLQSTFEQGVLALAADEEWRQVMDFFAGFHTYSFNNMMLIYLQYPKASRLAGFKQWQSRGRQVKKGSKAIKIFGFGISKKKNEDGQEILGPDGTPQTYTYYPILNVFDISQTEPIEGAEDLVEKEKELAPESISSEEDYSQGIQRLMAWLGLNGWIVSDGNTGSAQGETNTKSKTIILDAGLNSATKLSVLIHETAHAILHQDNQYYKENRGLRETEAESVSYIVGKMHGLDTSSISISYVADWSRGDKDILEKSASNAYSASVMIDKVLSGTLDK